MNFKKLLIDTSKLISQLYVFKLKIIFFRNGILCFGLTHDQRLFKLSVFIRNQKEALFEYGGRAMLSDEFFDAAEYIHIRSLMVNVGNVPRAQ